MKGEGTVSRNSLGQTAVEVPSGKHPNSHFETRRVYIEPSANGGFTVQHEQRLKKKFESMRYMDGGYREPITHVFGDAKDLHDHLQSIFKVKMDNVSEEDDDDE